MKKFLLILAILLIGYSGYLTYKNSISSTSNSTSNKEKNLASVQIGTHKYDVDIADNDAKREKGLQGRKSLPQNTGMLFLFPQKDRYSFWMKYVLFPLDIIWIDGNTIVDLNENVPVPLTATYTPLYQPKVPVDKALEVNAGEVKRNDIQIGQTVSFELSETHVE